MKRAALLLGTALLTGCNTGAPQRDVFIPPYAEKGCWARLYSEAQFAGPMRQLEGPVFAEALAGTPVQVPGLEQIAPQPLFTQVRSLQLGPHARVVGYGETLFRRRTLDLPPGARLADVASVGFHERIRSFTMQCEI